MNMEEIVFAKYMQRHLDTFILKHRNSVFQCDKRKQDKICVWMSDEKLIL